jgi:hypothetical protein
VSPIINPITGPTAPPTAPADAWGRKYQGIAGDPYQYGFSAEQNFYTPYKIPTAAKGGMFNADQYFADGGLVQPLTPPVQPPEASQPTMSYTDGQGALGSIAQLPGMPEYNTVGSDVTPASPMAPSPAAAAPSMRAGLSSLAMPNINAGSSISPIAQNPNVGYAVGNSPLSNL